MLHQPGATRQEDIQTFPWASSPNQALRLMDAMYTSVQHDISLDANYNPHFNGHLYTYGPASSTRNHTGSPTPTLFSIPRSYAPEYTGGGQRRQQLPSRQSSMSDYYASSEDNENMSQSHDSSYSPDNATIYP